MSPIAQGKNIRVRRVLALSLVGRRLQSPARSDALKHISQVASLQHSPHVGCLSPHPLNLDRYLPPCSTTSKPVPLGSETAWPSSVSVRVSAHSWSLRTYLAVSPISLTSGRCLVGGSDGAPHPF